MVWYLSLALLQGFEVEFTLKLLSPVYGAFLFGGMHLGPMERFFCLAWGAPVGLSVELTLTPLAFMGV